MKKTRLFTINKKALKLCFLLSFFSASALAEIDFEIKGLDKELKKNVEAYLEGISETELKQQFRFQSRVTSEITEALQAVGYFHPKITFVGQRTSLLGKPIFTINVTSGDPIIISEIEIKVLGEANSDSEFEKFLKKTPKKGDVLNQGKYEDIKAGLQRLAISRGYFDAAFTRSKLEISPSTNKAYVALEFDSKARYRYGNVTYHNSQIGLDRIDSFRDFEQGEPYLVTELSELNQKLASTAWFSSALVEADFAKAHENIIPINVTLERAPRNLFETGIGYSTNTGPRFKATWEKPWINSRGHSLDTHFYVSKPQQTLESSYKIPLENVEDEFYKLQLGVEHLDLNDTRSLEASASVSRHWLYQTGWQRIVFMRWLFSDFTQAGVSDTSNLLLPGVTFSRVRTRGNVMPYWGDRQSITFEMASPVWGSDVTLYRVFGETAWIRSLDKENTHRFITRAKAGIDITDDIEKVPPSLRFFTGGDNSIRGYGFESISPKDDMNELIGGEYMATASFEYNYQFTDNWWLAMFADIGDAWTGVSPEWKTSAGIGIRWKSPVGPVRFDVAHGFQNDADKIMFHFSLGPEL